MLFHRLSPSALRHHAEGIFFAERIFGVAIVNGEGKQVRLCCIGGQHVKHVKEDLGLFPRHTAGCRKSNRNAGCMVSILGRRPVTPPMWLANSMAQVVLGCSEIGAWPPNGRLQMRYARSRMRWASHASANG